MRAAYVTAEEYLASQFKIEIPQEKIDKYLLEASRNVDSLTYNRVVGIGFANLSPHQQAVVKEVVCYHANFLFENEDEINTVLTSYSINGVSAQFGSSWNVKIHNGVAMKRDIYTLLSQSGLCCRMAR